MCAGIIINPAAGPRRRRIGDAVRRAEAALGACSMEGLVRVTDRRGSAGELARSIIAEGATTVVAWGGDGTINEVAAEVAAAGVTLGVVPAGSGNGFARGLGLERRVDAALRTALTGHVRLIDMGEIGGRRFVNVAGVGFDAHMASVFNRLPRRGASAYFRAGLRELRSYRGETCTIRAARQTFTMSAFLVAVANCREYGNGAVIAPRARPDDGLLELVCVPTRSLSWMLLRSFRLFTGTIDRLPGVRCASGATIELNADRPLAFHVDGEVYVGGSNLRARVIPSSLRVRVPSVDPAGLRGVSGR
jgi:YegS/Rv2252/BmrU family lipid kinase